MRQPKHCQKRQALQGFFRPICCPFLVLRGVFAKASDLGVCFGIFITSFLFSLLINTPVQPTRVGGGSMMPEKGPPLVIPAPSLLSFPHALFSFPRRRESRVVYRFPVFTLLVPRVYGDDKKEAGMTKGTPSSHSHTLSSHSCAPPP